MDFMKWSLSRSNYNLTNLLLFLGFIADLTIEVFIVGFLEYNAYFLSHYYYMTMAIIEKAVVKCYIVNGFNRYICSILT